jgi:Coenzyme PQQ synthesis protein D (PqqD)
MLTLDQRFRSCKQVAAKVFDGEAILINMSTGMYYSMTDVGGLVWELLEARRSLEEIVLSITARHDVSREQAETDVQRLAAELLREDLIAATHDGPPGRAIAETPQQAKLPYQAPRLNVYRDMGELLALDPPAPELMDIAWNEPDNEPSR